MLIRWLLCVLLLKNGELKWIWMTCLIIDWFCVLLLRSYEYGIWWDENWDIELLMIEIMIWNIEIVDWNYEYGLRWWTMWIVCIWW